MARFELTGELKRFSTEVQEVEESIIVEAGKVYETAHSAVIAHLRNRPEVVELPEKAAKPAEEVQA